MIELKNIGFSYDSNSTERNIAVNNISLEINQGEFIGIAGHTGSGKTTIAQILAGLVKPSSGEIIIDGQSYSDYKVAARELRKKVGIVFQYPEHQLFEETVYKDIAFGPKNKGMSEKEIDECVKKSAEYADVPQELFDKSPFEISGGQKRRVAIAGVLATNPSVLILDEPAAGLDPQGRYKLFCLLQRIRQESGKSIILISHSMEDLAENADRILVLNNGNKILDDTPGKVFLNYDALKKSGLRLPEAAYIVKLLRENGLNIPDDIFTVEKAYKEIIKALEGVVC